MLEALLAAAIPNGLFVFVLLTVVLGGGAAWRTGQAVAEGWGALWPVIAYTLLIAATVRFLDYALFSGPLLSLASLTTDFLILCFFALLGHRARRARHMSEQYPWLFERAGPLGWRLRRGG
jgi:hypothetical protein